MIFKEFLSSHSFNNQLKWLVIQGFSELNLTLQIK